MTKSVIEATTRGLAPSSPNHCDKCEPADGTLPIFLRTDYGAALFATHPNGTLGLPVNPECAPNKPTVNMSLSRTALADPSNMRLHRPFCDFMIE
jgi:hypothetical protein